MKRLAIILAAVIVVVTGILIVAPNFIPEELARVRIAEQIEQWIGRPVTFTGEPVISFFPRPNVRLENVSIEDGDGSGNTFISVEELTGTVRLLPLLFGKVEVSSFQLVRPTIALRVDEEGRSNWTFAGTVGARVEQAYDGSEDGDAEVDEVVLGRFRIVDGTITYEEPGAPLATISDVSLDIYWPSTARPATASGSLVWRGERVDLSGTLMEPLELIAGRPSPGRFAVEGDLIRIAFDGTVGRSDLDFSFEGDTNVAMGSLRQVVDWTGAPIGQADTLADASISGHASWAWPVLSFSDAAMRLDGNAATGAFTVDFSGPRVEIVGTLALNTLDLSPYTDSFLAGVQAEGNWSDVAVNLPLFDYVDADVRISADRLLVGATHMEGFAASAIANNGVISLRLGEADFYGGHIQASLTAQYQAPHFSAQGQLTLTGVDARSALIDLVGVSTLSGRATGTLSVATDGQSWGELVHRLAGTLQASLTDGSLVGVDLVRAAAMTAPTVDAVATGSGETAFDAFDAQLSFYGGQLIADQITAAGPDFDLSFAGWGWLTQPEIEGDGVVHLHSRTDGSVTPLPFLVTGTWENPVFADDLGTPGFDSASAATTMSP
jgi:AsmA protein